jgi:UDP-N-acetylmuramoyl-L-alanyl-D-glutamate--2,6-diaminopimelate ligase
MKLEEYGDYFAAQDELEFEAKMNAMPETPERRIRRTTGRFSAAMWMLAKVAFGDPSTKLKVIGVTGTNGKTTTAWLIRDMLNLLGIPCAYIGTLGFGLPRGSDVSSESGTAPSMVSPPDMGATPMPQEEELRPLENTTPFSIELNAMLAECVERGCQAVAMEVSSHALAERRVDGIEFDVAVFTNLSQDHLDYHGTMEAYEAAKWRLFSEFPDRAEARWERAGGNDPSRSTNTAGGFGKHIAGWRLPTRESFVAALRFDCDVFDCILRWQEVGTWLFGECPSENEPCRPERAGDLQYRVADVGIDHLDIDLWDFFSRYKPEGGESVWRSVRVNLGGAYNVDNLVSAVAALAGLDIFVTDLVDRAPQPIFENLRPVPGRFEPVPNDSGIGIIVDYAHTPDALEKLLATVRPLTKGRVITVFGCGGDRDKSKRPLMARAAQEGSDVVVVTSDNPRTEDPGAIIGDICEGFEGPRVEGRGSDAENLDPRPSSFDPFIEPDRPAAVALALKLAEPGDTVVIAGKGHENYQIIGREKIHMDDRELARAGLAARSPS